MGYETYYSMSAHNLTADQARALLVLLQTRSDELPCFDTHSMIVKYAKKELNTDSGMVTSGELALLPAATRIKELGFESDQEERMGLDDFEGLLVEWSKQYPKVRLEVDCDGQEKHDECTAFFQGGKTYVESVDYEFPKFKKALLKPLKRQAQSA